MGCILKTRQRVSRSKFAGTSGHVFKKRAGQSCFNVLNEMYSHPYVE